MLSQSGFSMSQSFSALFMRVCQPLPVDLKDSSISASNLMVVNTFGFSNFGLPPLLIAFSVACISFGSWSNGIAFLNHSSVISSSSSSDAIFAFISASSLSEGIQIFFPVLVCAYIFIYLTFIGFSKTDNSNSRDSIFENQNHQSVIQETYCFYSCFAIVFPIVYFVYGRLKIKRLDKRETNSSFSNIFGVFDRVIFNIHQDIVYTLTSFTYRCKYLFITKIINPKEQQK